ncbi:uncharacterized protein LOC134740187 [Pongo pygmaeus]|uniref:uncharacterized protein LOC134740187 n=1 Tax=Pongo pygmaeus TaxID=9600 RepID=UPI00300C6347
MTLNSWCIIGTAAITPETFIKHLLCTVLKTCHLVSILTTMMHSRGCHSLFQRRVKNIKNWVAPFAIKQGPNSVTAAPPAWRGPPARQWPRPDARAPAPARESRRWRLTHAETRGPCPSFVEPEGGSGQVGPRERTGATRPSGPTACGCRGMGCPSRPGSSSEGTLLFIVFNNNQSLHLRRLITETTFLVDPSFGPACRKIPN